MTTTDEFDSTTAIETPAFWEGYTGITIHDPDGWRGEFYQDFSVPITLAEFNTRMASSTVSRITPW